MNIKRILQSFFLCLIFLMPVSLFALSPVEQGVMFKNIHDGDKLKSPVKVEMLVIGKTVAKAGDPTPNTGHHHIVINGTSIEKGKIIPADTTHIHFGQGQTETELNLKPGKYSLTLQFADANHLSYGKDWSTTINVEVVE